MLQSMGLQRVGHDQVTEQQQQKMDMSGETGDNQVELGVQLMVFNTNIKFLILTNVLIRNTWLKDTWKCSVLGFKLLCESKTIQKHWVDRKVHSGFPIMGNHGKKFPIIFYEKA